MSYLKERIKHVVRFRHKRGFGVHSPFMFNLIINVIRDKEKQFSYPEIVEKEDKLGHRERKVFRLLSRLIRYLQAGKIICFGRVAEPLSRYLVCVCDGNVDIWADRPDRLREADFIYVGRDSRLVLEGEPFLSRITVENHKCCIVIADIYKNGFNSRLWRQMSERATVSVDMMWYGILFFDPKLQPGHYNLTI